MVKKGREEEEEEVVEEEGRKRWRRRRGAGGAGMRGAERLPGSKRRCSCCHIHHCALPAAVLCLESDEFQHQLISL